MLGYGMAEETRQAWTTGQRSNICGRMHRKHPIPHYTNLKRELDALATALARSIDTCYS
jgi:hypothetical protein